MERYYLCCGIKAPLWNRLYKQWFNHMKEMRGINKKQPQTSWPPDHIIKLPIKHISHGTSNPSVRTPRSSLSLWSSSTLTCCGFCGCAHDCLSWRAHTRLANANRKIITQKIVLTLRFPSPSKLRGWITWHFRLTSEWLCPISDDVTPASRTPVPLVDLALHASFKWKGQLRWGDCYSFFFLHNIHDSFHYCIFHSVCFAYIMWCFICIIVHASRISLCHPSEQCTTVTWGGKGSWGAGANPIMHWMRRNVTFHH